MKAFLDERCLFRGNLAVLLKSWRSIADFTSANAVGLTLHIDRNAIRIPQVSQRLSTLTADQRVLYVPMLLGSEYVRDWRPEMLSNGSIYQLDTEEEFLEECAVGEAYENRAALATIALVGDEYSSFVGRNDICVARLDPPGESIGVQCGTTLLGLKRICSIWNCVRVQYDLALTRPPTDEETVLGQEPERFVRIGRFERNGRRHVYEELATKRLFYVDNLHNGNAAHLEVFNAMEAHIGTANLAGDVDTSASVQGRVIYW